MTATLADELLARAADPAAYRRWAEQVVQVGYCERPVRLVGQVEQANAATGEVCTTYASEDEPDGVTLKACGNRRASRCQPCSEVYRRDAWHLVAAGLRGGTVRPCHPRNPTARCQHGRPTGCWRRHEADDPCLGEPICLDCFDYEAAVVWNALAPALWRRTTIYLRRALARAAGLTPAELARVVQVSYAKVAEYQRRGVVHFHALIRLDAAGSDVGAPIEPPPPEFNTEVLEHAAREAVRRVAMHWPGHPDGQGLTPSAQWGEQLDIRHITASDCPDDLSAEVVAAYIAKYATKSTEALGALDRRLLGTDIEHLDLSEHVTRLVRACWALGGQPAFAALRLRRWAHQLGFGGHFLTKSRRYATPSRHYAGRGPSMRSARASMASTRRLGPPGECRRGHDPCSMALRRARLHHADRCQPRRRDGGGGPGPAPGRPRGVQVRSLRLIDGRNSNRMEGELLTLEDVAKRLDVPPRFVRRLVAERRITYHKVGRYVRFHERDIDDYLAANRIEAMTASTIPRRRTPRTTRRPNRRAS